MEWSCIITCMASLSLSLAKIPPNRILQVTPVCGSDGVEDATIAIITDLQIDAKAICDSGSVVNFVTTNNVTFNLPVSYPGSGASACVFNKRTDVKVYVVQVDVSYGEPGEYIHQHHEEFTITCTFDPKATNQSLENSLDEGLIAPQEIKTILGSVTTSTLVLQLIDVLGNDITGRDVWRSRKVQLKATTSGDDGEYGVRPISCDAIGQSGKRYSVIRAGCGDGLIFKKSSGFTTYGLSAKSPYFESFGIESDQGLRFECNFTLCDRNCDGSSCVNERKRRSSEDYIDTVYGVPILVESKQLVIAPQDPLPPVMSQSDILNVNGGEQVSNNSAVYWTAVMGVGLLVVTSLAVAMTICCSPRRLQVKENVKA